MRDLDTMEFMTEDDGYSMTILQCQSCGSEVEDDDELCCDEPDHESITIDQDGDTMEYGF